MITCSVSSLDKAVTCPEGQSAWALVPSLFGEKFASCRNNVSGYTSADLVQLEMKWPCTCAGKGCVVHSMKSVSLEHGLLFCCFASLLVCLLLLLWS